MAKSKSKTVSIANPDTLVAAGFTLTEDGWYPPNDMPGDSPLSDADAFALYTRVNSETGEKKRRPAENRATSEVVSIVRRVCQAYSNGFTAKGVWGEEEISLKKVVSSVSGIYTDADGKHPLATFEGEKVIKNAVNALKRNGEIEGTKKGYFRASAQASIDWSQFV